jgi:hypothetical protein
MKIIQRGVPPSEKEYKISCDSCKTTFSCLAKETKSFGVVSFVSCPVCQKYCKVDFKEFI